MRVIRAEGGSKTNLLANGSFEEGNGPKPNGWNPAPKGFSWVDGQGRTGSQGLRVSAANPKEWVGASQTVVLNQTNNVPLVIRGFSRAENISGSPDSGYSLYVDLQYTDGQPLWGQTANFRCGTHDWQQKELVIWPERPVRSLTLHCILRGHTGTAWFDDVSLQELTSGDGVVVFDGMPLQVGRQTARTNSGADAGLSGTFKTADGLQLQLRDSKVAALLADGAELTGKAPSGFLVRDVAANSDLYAFEANGCAELNLKLDAACSSAPDHVRVRGKVLDTTGKDRAITLYFALPLNCTGWHWGDDIRRSRVMRQGADYSRPVTVGCGSTGTMSLYPLAAVWNEKQGLGLGVDMNRAAQFRLACHPGTGQFYIAYDFGLSPETERFPSGAEFSFVIFKFKPDWGFRAAFEKYARMFPEYFQVRSEDQGIWMPFTDVSKVEGWEDFGFKYHEGVNNVPWDNGHGILSFRYTEPMTWWMRMEKGTPRTFAEALRVRDNLAAAPGGETRRIAKVSQVAAMFDESGQPALSFQDTPWCDGAVWSINPNPHLPVPEAQGSKDESYNGGTVHWNPALKAKLYASGPDSPQDGEYLDSLEGYVTADLNFRRDHFRYTTVPLTFATDTRQPALCKGLAVYEFTRWLSEDVHALGKLMFANSVPYRFSFLCPWLDVMGTETDWLRDGKYSPSSDEQMCLWRTMSGKKPYLLLMNTDYNTFTPELVEKYFQRSLFYGMFPSMFSHNAAENPYWQNPKWYNRDRALFKKYIPLVKRVAAAGWEPLTWATADIPQVHVERFGPGGDKTIYLTLLNESDQTQTTRLALDKAKFKIKPPGHVRDVISETQLGETEPWSMTLRPQQTMMIEIPLAD